MQTSGAAPAPAPVPEVSPDKDRQGFAWTEFIKKYSDTLLKTHKFLEFVEADLALNDLSDVLYAKDFVATFKETLGRRRKVARDHLPPADGLQSTKEARKAVREKLMEILELSESKADVSDKEIVHLYSLVHFDFLNACNSSRRSLRAGGSGPFSGEIVSAAFLYPFACHLEALSVRKITYGLDDDSWPYEMMTKAELSPEDEAKTRIREQFCTFTPTSSLVVLAEDLPRLYVDAYSSARGTVADDRARVLLQGVGTVRFANSQIKKYKDNKNFVLVAVYISDDGVAERSILYQEKGSNKVFRVSDCFELTRDSSRLEFARELYNFASLLVDEYTSNDAKEVGKWNDVCERLTNQLGLRDFYSASDRSAAGEGDDHSRSSSYPRAIGKSDNEGAELEAYGYKVEPEIFEDSGGGVWESVIKLPTNLRTVYRTSDARKKMIAKRLRERSSGNKNELEILQYLRTSTNAPPSPHVIQFIDSVKTSTATWLIFPQMNSIEDNFRIDSTLFGGNKFHGKIEQFCWGLIKGLAYLHASGVAHLDIKPGNLVYDGDSQLKIVDFDIAMRVEDEDEEIEGFRGTLGWTAPELGEEDGPKRRFSAIRADRWACGRVLQYFFRVEQVRGLSTIAESLMSSDPRKRPSLLQWQNGPEAAASGAMDVDDTVDVNAEVSQQRKHAAEGDEGDAQASPTKKPRVESS